VDTVLLDPEVAELLGALPFGTITSEGLAAIRSSGLSLVPPPLSEAVERTEYVVREEPELRVRTHRPRRVDGPLPAVYSIHAGGYVLGTFTMDDMRFDRWCQEMTCVGVSVEYRLAPETPYPGPLDDCYAGLRWVHDHADDLGVDVARLGIAGVSAGGGLAAALTHLVRDRGEFPISFQLLECPMIDDRQITSSSCRDALPVWSRESNAFGWRSYLGALYGADEVPTYAAPARATDLSGLPPALVIVGGADGFRDEDIDYALRLSQCGVPTELHVLPGAPHGVSLAATSRLAQEWRRLVDDWLSRQLGGRT
jgi:acetyl esterase/lipase